MSVGLRQATLDDVPRLKELGVLGWETTYHPYVSTANRARYLAGPFWSLERLTAVVNDPDRLTVVAIDDGAVIGFTTVEPVEAGVVELTRLYVDPAQRGAGIGSRLFEAGVDWATHNGARSMLVNVFADNHGGRRFYERAGCVLTRLELFVIGDQSIPDAWYELALRASSGH